jgi:hypothetical protein
MRTEVHTHIDPVSDRYIIEGSGLAIGSCALDCDTAMWEVKVGKSPEGVRIGVKRYNKKKSPDFSLALGDGEEEKDSSETASSYLKNAELKEGDVIGVYWDQTDLPMLSFSERAEWQLLRAGLQRRPLFVPSLFQQVPSHRLRHQPHITCLPYSIYPCNILPHSLSQIYYLKIVNLFRLTFYGRGCFTFSFRSQLN